MSSKLLSPLDDLKPFKSSWRVEVKVLHSWKQYIPQAGESFELILADEIGDKIHATCKKSFIAKLEKHLPVGSWKFIENFSLAPTSGQYRTTNHVYKMSFTSSTAITRSLKKSDDLFLSLTNFDQILQPTLNRHFLIDVIGQVVDMGEIQTVQVAGKDRKKVEFQLRDSHDERLPCCLWNRFAEQIRTACDDGKGEMVICVLRFAKVNFYKGELQITNAFESSKLLINAKLPEVDEFKKNLPEDGRALTILDPTELVFIPRNNDIDWHLLPTRTLQDVRSALDIEKCKVVCTIYANDTDYSWYYFGCGKCQKKLEQANNALSNSKKTYAKPTFYCSACEKTVEHIEPRFKLHLLVSDHNETSKVMLLDTVAQAIVGVSASQLLNGSFDEIEDPTDLPEAISALVGKTYQFEVCIEKENVFCGAEKYKCSRVNLGEYLIKKETVLDPGSQITNVSSFLSGEEVSLIDSTGQDFKD